MKKIAVFLADGFEEIEAIVPVDIWLRAGFEVKTISITGENKVTGSHSITFYADHLFDEIDLNLYDMIFLPGGMPGSKNLDAHVELKNLLSDFHNNHKTIAAICAAPMILGRLNILKGKNATCFPGYENELTNATYTANTVEVDGNIITARGAGVALEFALKIVEIFTNEENAKLLAQKLQVSIHFNSSFKV